MSVICLKGAVVEKGMRKGPALLPYLDLHVSSLFEGW